MKVDIELLKKIQGLLSSLEEEDIYYSDDSGYLAEEKYDELPGEMEMETINIQFPDDQDYTILDVEDFLEYMSEIDTIKRIDKTTVRTDHIVQTIISSNRMGYSGFEDKLYSYSFSGDGVDVTIVNNPFLIGVMNSREDCYEQDFGFGACEPYTAIEIKFHDDEIVNAQELVERVCYYLTDRMGVAIYPSEIADISALYDRMDEFYDEDDDDDNTEKPEVISVNLSDIPLYSPILKMYRQAKGVEDPEIQFLQYYKIVEFVSPLVAKKVAYERLNRRLDLLPSIERDHEYLDSILKLSKKYDTDRKDDSLALSVIESCVDVIPLFKMIPKRIRKNIKGTLKFMKDTLTDDDVSEEQLSGLQKQIASMIYDTRNSIVHAKSNYTATGKEILLEELSDANDMMDVIARSIINWNIRQPEGFRV